MFEEANPELEEINPFCRHLPEVLGARVTIYHGLKKWELMQLSPRSWSSGIPTNRRHVVDLAFATRRAESILQALAILKQAEGLHPNAPAIQFNLACYEAQLGNLNQWLSCGLRFRREGRRRSVPERVAQARASRFPPFDRGAQDCFRRPDFDAFPRPR